MVVVVISVISGVKSLLQEFRKNRDRAWILSSVVVWRSGCKAEPVLLFIFCFIPVIKSGAMLLNSKNYRSSKD